MSQIVADLADNHSIHINAFALNYQLPMSCIMRSGPMSMMGPCAIGDGDKRLSEPKWQSRLAQGAPNLAIFQDTAEANVWDAGFGGGHDDLFIYDAEGLLFAYLPSAMTETNPAIPQDMLTPSGYGIVRSMLILAARQPRERCATSTDSNTSGVATSPICWVVLSASILLLAVAGWLWRGRPRNSASERAALQLGDHI